MYLKLMFKFQNTFCFVEINHADNQPTCTPPAP